MELFNDLLDSAANALESWSDTQTQLQEQYLNTQDLANAMKAQQSIISRGADTPRVICL